jgi:hypothetical protein
MPLSRKDYLWDCCLHRHDWSSPIPVLNCPMWPAPFPTYQGCKHPLATHPLHWPLHCTCAHYLVEDNNHHSTFWCPECNTLLMTGSSDPLYRGFVMIKTLRLTVMTPYTIKRRLAKKRNHPTTLDMGMKFMPISKPFLPSLPDMSTL